MGLTTDRAQAEAGAPPAPRRLGLHDAPWTSAGQGHSVMWFGDPPRLVARWNQPPDELVNPKATGLSERAAEAGDRLAPVTRQLLKMEVAPESPPATTASLERLAAS